MGHGRRGELGHNPQSIRTENKTEVPPCQTLHATQYTSTFLTLFRGSISIDADECKAIVKDEKQFFVSRIDEIHTH